MIPPGESEGGPQCVGLRPGSFQVTAADQSGRELLARSQEIRMRPHHRFEHLGRARYLPGIHQKLGQLVLALPVPWVQRHGLLE